MGLTASALDQSVTPCTPQQASCDVTLALSCHRPCWKLALLRHCYIALAEYMAMFGHNGWSDPPVCKTPRALVRVRNLVDVS